MQAKLIVTKVEAGLRAFYAIQPENGSVGKTWHTQPAVLGNLFWTDRQKGWQTECNSSITTLLQACVVKYLPHTDKYEYLGHIYSDLTDNADIETNHNH